MQRHLATGLAAAEAAKLATRPAQEEELALAAATEELAAALARFDEGAAHALFDSVLARVSLDTLLRELVIPYLHDLGERWERGEVSIAQEHFASTLLRGRLLGLARGWSQGMGPPAVLACAPGEQHDLGLVAFGIALRARGWRIVYLGPDTPIASGKDAAAASRANLGVVSAVDPRRFRPCIPEVEKLARTIDAMAGTRDAPAASTPARATLPMMAGGGR